MPRLTVGNLMLGVAGVALLLGAVRVHSSLGALVFGLLSVAIVRTRQRLAAERAAGRVVTRGTLARESIGSLGVAAANLLIVFAGMVITSLVVSMVVRGSLTQEALIVTLVVGVVVGLGLLRIVQSLVRDARAGLPIVCDPLTKPPIPPAPSDPTTGEGITLIEPDGRKR